MKTAFGRFTSVLPAILRMLLLTCTAEAGAQVWVGERANAYGFAMTLDSVDRCCIVGPTAGTPEDIVARKYTATGGLLWETVHSGPGYSRDYAYDACTDARGYTYVVGTSEDIDYHRSMLVFAIDSCGAVRWSDRYLSPDSGSCMVRAATLGPGGKLYVASEVNGYDADIALWRYDTSGRRERGVVYDTPVENEGTAWDVVATEDGRVYVCGNIDGSSRDENGILLAFASADSLLWVRELAGPAQTNDQWLQAALSPDGAVCVTGEFDIGLTSTNWCTAKYDSAGDLLWAKYFDGPDHDKDNPHSLAVDHTGAVAVTGFVWFAAGYKDLAVVKYLPSGDTAWTRYYGLRASVYTAESREVVVDATGNIYTTGEYDMPRAVGWLTTMLDPEGNILWQHTYPTSSPYVGTPQRLALDRAGNIYVGGQLAFGQSQIVLKYRSPLTGLAEAPGAMPRRAATQTFVRAGAPLHLPAGTKLVDALGRVAESVDKPGVYFVESTGTASRRLVVVK